LIILIRLDSDDWLDVEEYVFYMLGFGYTSDLDDGCIDDLEDQCKLIEWRVDY